MSKRSFWNQPFREYAHPVTGPDRDWKGEAYPGGQVSDGMTWTTVMELAYFSLWDFLELGKEVIREFCCIARQQGAWPRKFPPTSMTRSPSWYSPVLLARGLVAHFKLSDDLWAGLLVKRNGVGYSNMQIESRDFSAYDVMNFLFNLPSSRLCRLFACKGESQVPGVLKDRNRENLLCIKRCYNFQNPLVRHVQNSRQQQRLTGWRLHLTRHSIFHLGTLQCSEAI